MFTDSFMLGGTERQFTRLAASLDRERFEVHIGCLHRSGPLALELESIGLELTEFPLTSFYDANTLRQFVRLVRFFRERRIQVLHAFDFYTDVFTVPAARAAGVAVILASRRELMNLRTPWQRRAVKIACKMSTGVVVNSLATAKDAIDAGLAGNEALFTLPNCIDLDRFKRVADTVAIRAKLGIAPDAPVAGTLCVLRPEKDLETFLRACQMVRESFPSARFAIIGEGPERRRLEELADDLAIADAVLFLGARNDIPELLATMDVFVLTSRTESFPNAILEAMAAGRAVVATNVGGVPEVVWDGESGLLAPAGDASEIASRIVQLLGDPARRQAMGNSGLERVKTEYAVETVSARLQALYRRLLNERLLRPERNGELRN